jgi:uncharacterized membrane protein
MDILQLSLLAATFLTGLIAGLFYSYSCSVNLGLAKLSDTEYLKAMKSINREILNPWFFLSFMGTLMMIPLSTWLHYDREGNDYSFYLLLSASCLYAIGVFGVTVVKNVPLNESLDRFDIESASKANVSEKRASFEPPWNRFHLIRTVANSVVLILVLLAIIVGMRG